MTERDVLLYLHGFQSSPQSAKATQFRQYLQAHHPKLSLVTPQLACYPLAAWQQIDAILDVYGNRLLGVVGSSLGGFLAARVAYLTKCRAVVINPAVRPHEVLGEFLGEHDHPYTAERFCLTEKHIDQLKELAIPAQSLSDQLWLLSQTGDEVLDFRQAVLDYKGSRQTVECGGDHSFQGFNRYCGPIVEFLTR